MTYYHADGLGSIVKRTDQAGAVVHEYRYDAWGKIEAGATEAGYAFTGREWDPETGLYYYRARYYDPKVGRFLSEDPIGFFGGVNFYAYVDNNPVNLIDPTGLLKGPDPFTTIGMCAATGIGAAATTATATAGFALMATPVGMGSDFAPGERRPPTCDKTNSCDRDRRKIRCQLIGSGGKGPKPGAKQRCTYACDDGTQINRFYEDCSKYPEVEKSRGE